VVTVTWAAAVVVAVVLAEDAPLEPHAAAAASTATSVPATNQRDLGVGGVGGRDRSDIGSMVLTVDLMGADLFPARVFSCSGFFLLGTSRFLLGSCLGIWLLLRPVEWNRSAAAVSYDGDRLGFDRIGIAEDDRTQGRPLVETRGSALVTGASRGIGRSVALELAARGFNTVAAMRDPGDGADLAGDSGGRITVARLDVTDSDTYQLPDDLRVLVNNAGVDTDYLPVEHSSVDDWRSMFETNVLGVVALTMAAVPVLRANRPAVVCNISSSSILAWVPFYSAYRATKAAASAFGESLRVEVAPSGIRVVEILPGPIDTDMFRQSTGDQAATRFERYRPMADQAARLRREAADPLVSSPADAARLVADAILDDSGPMRYGCDPLSVGLLDLWRQSDDESMFALTGQSLLDLVEAADPNEGAGGTSK